MPARSSSHPGMGAVPHDDGVTFRVWAPQARQVAVVGDFCGWDARRRTVLAKDHHRSGTWSAFVPGAGPGTHYRFLVRRGGPYLSRQDPCARQVTGARGASVVFDPRHLDWGDEPFRAPGWDDLVVYEMHVPTFAATAEGPGTFDTAVGRLDHLAWLGVSAVEVMPPFEFASATSWGYNPSQLYAVESSYGGPHAFARFVREAHARGIAVILDVVHNHLGPDGPHLWRFDGAAGRRRYGGAYFYNDRRALTPWGATRPNYDRKAVRNFLRDSAVMWLEDFRVDGLRFDGTNFVRSRWGDVRDPAHHIGAGDRYLASLTSDLRSRQPWKLLVAEDMQRDPAVTRSPQEGGLGFHSQWDAGFVHTVRAALEAADDAHRDVRAVAAAVLGGGGELHERVVYTESHDEVANGRARVPEQITPGHADSWHARTRSALGLVLTLTAPGIPMLFQGQDVLEDGWFTDTRPVDWSKAHHRAGFLHLVRQLVLLRRDASGTTRGLRGRHTDVLRADDGVLAYHRWDHGGPGDDVVVVVNLSTHPRHDLRLGMPRAGRWRVRCNTDAPGFGPGLGAVHAHDTDTEPRPWDGRADSALVTVGPYAALVLSQDD
ncbi:alpha-amylase family glycosyl hydrolase [Serinicoccus sediminis]|uniref:alpha-amylase family glycosyl hydrolase n=1 Tax=Serinicoccus sediminis TaxID=2306021 RepID=UPI001EE14D8B|nr:alpha-amylase family glycosyl hydrolase [Serinicoccus sediminis]